MKNLTPTGSDSSTSKSHKTKQSSVMDEDILFQTNPKRYTVGVTAAQDPGDDGTWEDIEVSNRSLSQERLTRPPRMPPIIKTTQVEQRSYHVDDVAHLAHAR